MAKKRVKKKAAKKTTEKPRMNLNPAKIVNLSPAQIVSIMGAIGHSPAPPKKNGDVIIISCLKCENSAIVREDGVPFGVALSEMCSLDAFNKFEGSFPEKIEYTPEFKKKIEAPWKPPSAG